MLIAIHCASFSQNTPNTPMPYNLTPKHVHLSTAQGDSSNLSICIGADAKPRKTINSRLSLSLRTERTVPDSDVATFDGTGPLLVTRTRINGVNIYLAQINLHVL